jgi:hypothetical protein
MGSEMLAKISREYTDDGMSITMSPLTMNLSVLRKKKT